MAIGVIAHRSAEEFGIEPHPIHAEIAVFSSEVFDFGSGCLCCSPRGEMTRQLGEAVSHGRHLDLLLIRTGPLAAPLVFAKSVLCSSDEVSSHFELASIIAVVDPRLAPRHLAAGSVEWQARSQVEAADLVLLNPHAEADAAQCSTAAALADEVQATISIERLPLQAAGLDRILQRRAFSISRARSLDPDFDKCTDAPPAVLTLSGHDRRLVAGCAVEDAPLHESKLRALCERLVASGCILRLKAVARVHMEGHDGRTGWLRVDAVEEAIHFEGGGAHCKSGSASMESTDAACASKIFVLGRGLPVGSLRRDFQWCCVPDGFEYAADTELHFGRPALTAESTTRAGLEDTKVPAGTLCAVQSDLPGIWVARLSEGGFVAFAPPTGGVVQHVIEHPAHGACAMCVTMGKGSSDWPTENAQAGPDSRSDVGSHEVWCDTSLYRLSDGKALDSRDGRLELFSDILIAGVIYVNRGSRA
jgi:G3E family GTPase